MSGELSTGKTIFILAVVVGCFAVLWPKVFYPMLTASIKQSGSTQVLNWRDPANAHVLSQLCFLLEEQQDPSSGFVIRLSDQVCLDYVKKWCGVEPSERIIENFRLSVDKTNMTECLHRKFDITIGKVRAAAPPPTRIKPYQPQSLPHPHVRPERPSLLHPEGLHPALREKGRTMPQRTIEKQARPGPMPGIRPPMGGGGHMSPPQSKGSGAMGIIMPLYTVGIIIFFVYTIMKVLFKKSDEEDCKSAKLKDFHLDPEYRKYVFAEEYLDSANASHRDLLKRQERESSKQRRRQDSTAQPDTKIEDEQMDQLRRRLEETEKAMERLMSQMGSVTDKLTAAKITEVLSQAQAQAKILKEQEALLKGSSLDGQEAELNHKGVEETGSSISTPTDSTAIEKEVCEAEADKRLNYEKDTEKTLNTNQTKDSHGAPRKDVSEEEGEEEEQHEEEEEGEEAEEDADEEVEEDEEENGEEEVLQQQQSDSKWQDKNISVSTVSPVNEEKYACDRERQTTSEEQEEEEETEEVEVEEEEKQDEEEREEDEEDEVEEEIEVQRKTNIDRKYKKSQMDEDTYEEDKLEAEAQSEEEEPVKERDEQRTASRVPLPLAASTEEETGSSLSDTRIDITAKPVISSKSPAEQEESSSPSDPRLRHQDK